MRSFEQQASEFRKRGVAIAAVSVDSPEESRKLVHAKGFTFDFLSDPKTEVIRRYGVLHPAARGEGDGIARPAEFLVDAQGIVRWVKLTDDIRVRARPEVVLQAIDNLLAK